METVSQESYRGYRSVGHLLEEVASKHADLAAYQYKTEGRWVEVTWGENWRTTGRAAKALISLGVDHGDRVAVLGQTRLEWAQSDFGAVRCGAVTVGIYPSNLPVDCAYILNHSEAVVLFVENREQLEKIREVRSDLRHLRTIVIWDGDGGDDDEVLTWRQFLELGDAVPDDRLAGRAEEVRPDDLASLVYTSGTTGVPKGVMISHKNLIFITWTGCGSLRIEPGLTCLLFLPLAHVFARLILYCCARRASMLAFVEELGKLPENLREVRPHWIPSVPRVYEKVHDRIVAQTATAGGLKQKIFDWAIRAGLEASRRRQGKQRIPLWLRAKLAVADRLVFEKIRAAFGGRLIYAISGAAPLNKTHAEFFDACGVLILEGIGMTENTSFSHVNRIGNNKFGTVGLPGPDVEVKIADDGEVLFRGDNVMPGYFKNPESTAETIDSDGWLHSGDIGEIDEDGFLTITDRKKDLIVTAGGKNVAPQRIERIVRTSRYISHVMAYGDRRKYIVAIVTLELPSIQEWAVAKGLTTSTPEGLATEPAVRELIEAEVEERNGQLASYETVKKFHIAPVDFSIEGGELTPTQKIKRKVVIDRYREQLDALY
jgi:long-chain acyl-CoA synthetase